MPDTGHLALPMYGYTVDTKLKTTIILTSMQLTELLIHLFATLEQLIFKLFKLYPQLLIWQRLINHINN